MTTTGFALWHRLLGHAHDAGRVAYIEQGTGRAVTYGQLVEQVLAAAPSPGVQVMNEGNRIGFVIRFLAAMLNDRPVLPIDPSAAAESPRLTALAASDDGVGPAVLLASSGTTGQPKLIRRERAGLDVMARSMAEAIGLTPADRVLAAVPLAHSYGLEHGLLAPLWAGCTVLLCDGLDLPPVAAAWQGGATVLPAVPSMLEGVLRSGLAPSPSLRVVYTAGAPLPASVAAFFEKTYGVPVAQIYGMTEIGSVVVRHPRRDSPGSVGRAVAGVSLRLSDDGELLVRSPSMLSRYVGDRLDLIGGHFPTGDLATIDDNGELTLTGRRRLLIDVGGAKVNPQEVEAVLAEHPGVAACVVLPLVLSETVCKVRAIVVATNVAQPPSAVELRDFIRQRLARHKVPRLIEFRDALPRTPSGKIARQLLETP